MNDNDYTITDLLDIIAERGKRIAELQAGLAMLYSWADNWDSPFMDDPEWRETDGPRIKSLLSGTASQA